ncbi:peptidoglycan D,D-transpeptidase FtsI family protein [Thalassoglobus polymorphus]|uniref:Stage V sporulation protein D n=1 Tax=Thalassoglobus polymorphus TaxID=2527994 RepID=A0A517QJ38_9PLAN|nr:penicillin-binding transpeptidase domain-containing protein [Thalassoglobus polymorphus]QDT31624.1 Stage V sporulation protein D [Thalassoglobus polymorphus]
MQNQPFSDLGSSREDSNRIGNSPQMRLGILGGIIVGVVFLIGIRVCHVQAMIAQQFISPWEKIQLVEETIPARSGRILSRDGAVLAFDETRYDLAVDYRWLEEPFDAVWLRRQVYSRLDRNQRDDPVARELMEQELERDRQALFEKLSSLTKVPTDVLLSRAERLQKRIERMLVSVEARRSDSLAENDPQPLDFSQGLSGIIETIRKELTTPPRRYQSDPIILKEELEPHVLVENVPLSVVAAIQSTPHRFPGVHVQSHASRIYPLGDVAPHLIGLRKASGGSDQITGQGGVEEAFDDVLTGHEGTKIHKVNRRGETLSSDVSQDPIDGKDVVLTIDSRLQRTAEELLDQALSNPESDPQPVGGVVIAMDLWTGDLLAAAAAPRYSLQMMLKPSEAEWKGILEHPHQPLFPRATKMAIPPGSVFKVVTSAAALEQGEVTPDEVLECRGYLNSPDQLRCMIFRKYGLGHGEIHLDDALCRSCNVFFYDLAQRVGPDVLVDWSSRFGFGLPTGIELPSESSGFLPNPHDPEASKKWYPGTSMQLAIGQGELLATPLQVTRMMASIGNGGYLVTPRVRLVQSRELPDTERTLKKIPGLSERSLTTIRHGLEMVVHHPHGTGVAALTPSMTMAAKTGTAEVDGKPDHAWFAGYAPVESPRVAFCVVLEHGGSGGDASGPIVKHLMTEMIGLGLLRPQWSEETTQVSEYGAN